MKTYKPRALKVIWNKDLSLSVYPAGGGARLMKTTMWLSDKTWLDTVAPFAKVGLEQLIVINGAFAAKFLERK